MNHTRVFVDKFLRHFTIVSPLVNKRQIQTADCCSRSISTDAAPAKRYNNSKTFALHWMPDGNAEHLQPYTPAK